MGEKVKEFLAYLESHVGDAYVWGAQGERVDNRADLENGYGARRLRAARPNARLHTSKKPPKRRCTPSIAAALSYIGCAT